MMAAQRCALPPPSVLAVLALVRFCKALLQALALLAQVAPDPQPLRMGLPADSERHAPLLAVDERVHLLQPKTQGKPPHLIAELLTLCFVRLTTRRLQPRLAPTNAEPRSVHVLGQGCPVDPGNARFPDDVVPMDLCFPVGLRDQLLPHALRSAEVRGRENAGAAACLPGSPLEALTLDRAPDGRHAWAHPP